MKTQVRENGLGTLAAILLLAVPVAMWLYYDLASAGLSFFVGLIIVGTASCAKGDYAGN